MSSLVLVPIVQSPLHEGSGSHHPMVLTVKALALAQVRPRNIESISDWWMAAWKHHASRVGSFVFSRGWRWGGPAVGIQEWIVGRCFPLQAMLIGESAVVVCRSRVVFQLLLYMNNKFKRFSKIQHAVPNGAAWNVPRNVGNSGYFGAASIYIGVDVQELNLSEELWREYLWII